MAKRRTRWPAKTKRHFEKKLGLLGVADEHRVLDNCIDLEFITKRTSCINGLIYYPFVVIALTIVSRSTVFADFPMSLPILITQVISLLIVIGCAIMLNHIAEEARSIAKKDLSDEIIKANGLPRYGRARQWQSLLDQVNGLREGAFQPFLQQPIVGAVLLPLSSVASTALLENGIFPGI